MHVLVLVTTGSPLKTSFTVNVQLHLLNPLHPLWDINYIKLDEQLMFSWKKVYLAFYNLLSLSV